MSRTPSLVLATLLALATLRLAAQATQPGPDVDTSRLGPQIGSQAPPFSGTDQAGRRHSLESDLGPKGAMLVFFRSADW